MALVLVADDDPLTRRIVAKVVTNLGHTVIYASDGDRALEVLLDNPKFDMLITDVVMPRMDGRKLFQLLRKEHGFTELPILLMSGVAGINEIRTLVELGPTRFLPKPLNLEHLKDYVERMVPEPAGAG
jgi:CheY-like chemotaxis protein